VSARPGPHRAALAALALALLAACGSREREPRWIPLARGFHPAPLLERVQAWQRAAGLDPALCRESYEGVEVRHTLARADWTAGAEPGRFEASLPGGAFTFGPRGFLRLSGGAASAVELSLEEPLRAGSFHVRAGRIELQLAPGGEPEPQLELVQYLEDGRERDEVWQVRAGSDEVHAGLSLWSGGELELTCELPEASALRFRLRYVTRAAPAPVHLRVRLDGELLLEHASDSAALAVDGPLLEVALPPRARARTRLAFELEGPPGRALLLQPTLGPSELGTYRERPWPDPRPDFVVFLADTFRADGLEVGGGPRALAPNLNRFADGALRCANARANAAWTLPSIGTLLTGLAPGQHTANDTATSLPQEIATLVERLARSGYRTGAVTDAAFFTPVHGLEQGFESFRANQAARWDLDATVRQAREFLARDDGRPVFLVVHTYRTHMPYRVGPDEDLGPWKALRAAGCRPLEDRRTLADEEYRARLADCAPRFRDLYYEGVRDLDRGFGELLVELERVGLLARGYVLFTSDHGEALGENDDIFHGGALWDSKLRVPLVLAGPGIAARRLELPATLLDVTPTLAALAGLERDARWPGRSLLELAEERPSWAFRLQRTRQIALLEGGRKLLADDPAAFGGAGTLQAYDLTRDPPEAHPEADADWARPLALRHADELAALLEPVTDEVEAELDAQHLRELRALGYDGDEAEDDEGKAVPPGK
jgi:choline-sulfatase